jgi:type VII secretion ATPase EccA
MSEPRNLFDAGATALGLLGGGRPNTEQALRYFTAASESDPQMCDAWLGRILCGDGGSHIVYRAWNSRQNMHAEINRLGVNVGYFMPKFDIGMGIVSLEQSVYDRGVLAVALARMLAMGNPPDYNEALETLEQAPATGLSRWVRAAMYYRAQRWLEVISTLTGHDDEFREDQYLRLAVQVALGVAHAHLGEIDASERQLAQADSAPIDFASAKQTAQWYLALIARERGDEEKAVGLLRQLNAVAPSQEVAAAIADAGIRLRTTSPEVLDARTDAWDPNSGPDAQEMAGARAEEQRAKMLAEATQELDTQIGMTELKEQIKTFRARMRMAEKRREMGLKTPESSNHMVFVGPPGTGKTTVARIIAKLLCGLGIVATDSVVEVSGRELLGEYEGHSEAKLRQVMTRARDGVLFLDEAYALVQQRTGGVDPFGKAVADEMLKYLEDQRGRLVVIIAGYEADIDRFLASNDGLRSRFAHRFRFETYTPEELVAIAQVLAEGRDDLLDGPASEILLATCDKLAAKTISNHCAVDFYGNGRFVRKVLEAAADLRDLRIEGEPPELLDAEAVMTIREPDMQSGLAKVMSELDGPVSQGTR